MRTKFVICGEFPGDGKQKPVAFPDPESVSIEIEGLRVMTLDKLIEIKLASGMTARGRLQDLADVQRLILQHRLDETFAQQLDPYVREKYLELLQG